MKILVENFSVTLCGLATSILVAVVDAAIACKTGFDPYKFAPLFAIPIGAALTGFAAASGYYYGSLYFQKLASRVFLVQIVVIASFTQLLIYGLDYAAMVLEDGHKIVSLISFISYLDVSLTSAHYDLGQDETDTYVDAVGSFGYWVAAFQFVGFLFGCLIMYLRLLTRTVCESCNIYLYRLAKKRRTYAKQHGFDVYFNALLIHPVNGEKFAALMRSEARIGKAVKGAVQVDTSLLGCPRCKRQIISENVHVYSGSKWKAAEELNRWVRIPEGFDSAPLFRI